jgi:magnesium transporter
MSAVDKKDEKLNIETIKWGKITWINIEKPTGSDMEYLAKNYLFNLFDLEDCLSRIERPKIDEYENYLFLVLHFPVFKMEARVTTSSQVSIFIGADFLVTVHTGALKPLAKLFNDCQQNERAREEHMARSSGYLLYRILDRLVDYCFPILNRVIANIEAAEDRLFSEPARDTVQEISVLRRDVMSYRRIIRHQPASETLEEYKEVVEGLNATSDSLFSHRTNEVMKMLTILGTILLPLLVISGIYGMNVSLPFEDSSFAFPFIILFTLCISGSMLAYFRYRRWI